MPRIIRYLVPGLERDTPERLRAALASTGRRITTPDGAGAAPPRLLRWQVRALAGDAGTCREVDDSDADAWDLSLARSLSQVVDGFVAALTTESTASRYGEALFFAGRTVEARSWFQLGGDLALAATVGDG